MALNKDIKVGLLAILAIVILTISYFFMRGTLMQSGNPVYSALFTNVEKLKKSDRVYLNGVVVGNVTSIEFADIKNPESIKVSFSSEPKLKIPKDSKIQIISTSIMGNMGLKLILGTNQEGIKSGEQIKGVDELSMLGELSNNIKPLTDNSNVLLSNVNTLFDRKSQENLYITIDQLNKTLATLNTTVGNVNTMVASNQQPIHQTMMNFEKMSQSLVSKQAEINQIISNSKDITTQLKNADVSKSLNKMSATMDELNKMLADINKGNGSLGKLMKDPQLYNELNNTINSANSLMKDMKENPNRYVRFSVFGGKK